MKRPLRILHAADLHLDSPFEALGERAAERRREQRELLRQIAALARERQADLLLLAGDLLDTDWAYTETAEAIYDALSECACRVFIAPGNHDYYTASCPYARMELPDNVHVFSSGVMTAVELPELGARVYGAAFTDSRAPALLRHFAAEREADTWAVGVLHGEVGNPASPYDPIREEEIAGSGLDYLALGHVHSGSGLRRAGETFYAWPGCAEGRGFDECGEKGVLFVELEEGRCEASFLPLPGRRYEVLRFDLSSGWSDVHLPGSAGRDLYRIVLTGETETAPDLRRLYELLRDRFYALQIVDQTTLRADLWERSEQDSLRGLFLRRMRALYDSAGDESERQAVVQAVRWGLAALDGGEAVKSL